METKDDSLSLDTGGNIAKFRQHMTFIRPKFYNVQKGIIAHQVEHRTENPTAQVRILLVPQQPERRTTERFMIGISRISKVNFLRSTIR